MRTEKEIRENLEEIENSEVPLDREMYGYVRALEWVLEEFKNPEIKPRDCSNCIEKEVCYP
jgi:hypothetical protein